MNNQKKAWKESIKTLNSLTTWSSANKNYTIEKSMKYHATYLKGVLATTHSFKLFKCLQDLMKENEALNNGEMARWKR